MEDLVWNPVVKVAETPPKPVVREAEAGSAWQEGRQRQVGGENEAVIYINVLGYYTQCRMKLNTGRKFSLSRAKAGLLTGFRL
jgi:hypothetical protein